MRNGNLSDATKKELSDLALQRWEVRLSTMHSPKLLPIGTKVRLSERGLAADGPKHAGLSAESRGEVVLGMRPQMDAWLAVYADGRVQNWPAWVWTDDGVATLKGNHSAEAGNMVISSKGGHTE